MSNFTFLVNEVYKSEHVISAGSDDYESSALKSTSENIVSGEAHLGLLSYGDVIHSDVYRIRVKSGGLVDNGSTFIINTDVNFEDYNDSNNWLGVNAFYKASGDVFIYPYNVVRPRVTSDGLNIYSSAIRGLDGTTLDLFKLDTTTFYFDFKGTVNDYSMDGGVEQSALFYTDNILYCVIANVDAAGDCRLKASTDEGVNWSLISEFELCSYSDTLDKIDAKITSGKLLVMGTYTVSKSYHLMTYCYSNDLGYNWVKSNEIFYVDQTSYWRPDTSTSIFHELGFGLNVDPIDDQFILGIRSLLYHQDTSTFRNMLYFYTTKDCEFFNNIYYKNSAGAPNSNITDSTTLFDPNVVVTIGSDSRRMYSFCGYQSMDNWRGYTNCIRSESVRIPSGIDSTTNFIYAGMKGIDYLKDIFKYKGEYIICAESQYTDRTSIAALRLGEWSTISETSQDDQCYTAWDYAPNETGWGLVTGGGGTVKLSGSELHLINTSVNHKIYKMRISGGGVNTWSGVTYSANDFDNSVVKHRANLRDGFTIRTKVKMPYMASGSTDTTQTAIGMNVIARNARNTNASVTNTDHTIAGFCLLFAPDSIFVKRSLTDTPAVTRYLAHNMSEELHDILIGVKQYNVRMWYKPESSKGWSSLFDFKMDSTGDFTTNSKANHESATSWGNNIGNGVSVDCTSIWKEFRCGRKDDGGLSDGFVNPDDLLGYNISTDPVYLEENVKIAFDGGEAVVGDNWSIKDLEINAANNQGVKENIFNSRTFLEWRSKTDTTTDWITFGGEYCRFDTVVFKNVNFDYCHLQGQNRGSDATNWEYSLYSLNFDTTIDFREDGDPSSRVHNNIIITTDPTNLKYFRILIPQQDTTQGYYSIGQVAIGQRVELLFNPEHPIKETESIITYKVEVKSGEDKYLQKESCVKEWDLNFKAVDYTFYKQIKNLVEGINFNYKPLMFCYDFDASCYEVFNVRVNTDLSVTKNLGSIRDFKMTLEEVI